MEESRPLELFGKDLTGGRLKIGRAKQHYHDWAHDQ